MPRRAPSLSPRKTPVQARAVHTVDAILEASVQVLLAGGPERLTTTRVAERAGVSVGSLYQYFPNKQALLAAVLQRHLGTVVDRVEAACAASRGGRLGDVARAIVDAFVDAKLHDVEASRALYAVAAEVDGARIVRRLGERAQRAIADALASARDRRPRDAALAAFMLATAMTGPVQGLLQQRPARETVEAVRSQLVAMADGYLAAVADPAPAG